MSEIITEISAHKKFTYLKKVEENNLIAYKKAKLNP